MSEPSFSASADLNDNNSTGNVADATSNPAADVAAPVTPPVRTQAQASEANASSASDSVPATHTVSKGESLMDVVRKYYGPNATWHHLFETNKEAIGPNPAAPLEEGTELKLPASGPAQ